MAKKVLIIDDETNIRRLVRFTLLDEGYEIHEATDGKSGLDLARSITPDLIILDVMMPGLIGYQVCEEVRKDPRTAKTYVIFLSARDSVASERACQDAGGNLFIVKPFDPAALREAVKKGLGGG